MLWHNGVYGWRLLTAILKGLKTIIYLLLIHYLHSDSGAADGYKNQNIDRIHLVSVFLQLLLCSTKQAQVPHTESVNCEYIYILSYLMFLFFWCTVGFLCCKMCVMHCVTPPFPSFVLLWILSRITRRTSDNMCVLVTTCCLGYTELFGNLFQLWISLHMWAELAGTTTTV